MIRAWKIACLGVFLVLLSLCWIHPTLAQKELPQAQKRALQYPRVCAGITMGVSTSADVQRLYGKGYFVADEDHLGGRYYVDSAHQVTLHVAIGVDQIIDTVEYQQGVHLPGKWSAHTLRQATTSRLSSEKSFGSGFTLGTSAQSILDKYGKPGKDTRRDQKRKLHYDTDYTVTKDVLNYEAEFRFQKDHLVYVSLQDGE